MSDCPQVIEKNILLDTERSVRPLKPGEQHFLVSMRWYRLWQAWVSSSEAGVYILMTTSLVDSPPSVLELKRPGPIDNTDIVDAPGILKHMLQEQQDFVVLSAKSKDALVLWYGGHEPIARSVIEITTSFGTDCGIEVYPLQLKVRDESGFAPMPFSRRSHGRSRFVGQVQLTTDPPAFKIITVR